MAVIPVMANQTQTYLYEVGPNLTKLLGPFLPSFLTAFSRLELTLSKLSDAVAALTKSVDDAIARDVALVADLNKQIDDLKAQLAAGGLSPAEEDALADHLTTLQGKIDALDVTSPATITP